MVTALLATLCFAPLLILSVVAADEATQLHARLHESGAGRGGADDQHSDARKDAAFDNLVRPLFVQFCRLELSSFAVFVGMLGGLTVAGPFGILLGPLVLRLAREALEQREARARLPIVA
jgi:hypothetical protein